MIKVCKKAFIWSLSDERGISLIETMVALFVTLLSLFILTSLLDNIQNLESRLDHSKQAEWHIFLHQLPNEVKGYQLVHAEGDRMTFKKENGGSVYISCHGQNVVRQVNYKGYQPLLTHVERINYQLVSKDSFNVSVDFTTGESYQAQVFLN